MYVDKLSQRARKVDMEGKNREGQTEEYAGKKSSRQSS